MNILSVSAFVLAACIAASLLRNISSPIERLLPILAAGVVLVVVLSSVGPLVATVEKMFSYTDISSEYISIALKALGVCYLSTVSSDICTDSGQKALSTQVTIAGKVAVVLMTLPFLNEIIRAVMSLIE